jgi:hypothetical protein
MKQKKFIQPGAPQENPSILEMCIDLNPTGFKDFSYLRHLIEGSDILSHEYREFLMQVKCYEE